MPSVLIWWLVSRLSVPHLYSLVSVICNTLVVHNFLKHLKLVLNSVCLHLFFLDKLTLRLLTHYYWFAKLLRLRVVHIFRTRLGRLWWTVDFDVLNLQWFLSSLCEIVIVKLCFFTAEISCIYLVNYNWIFYSL